jgi:hypothetical protein
VRGQKPRQIGGWLPGIGGVSRRRLGLGEELDILRPEQVVEQRRGLRLLPHSAQIFF